MAHRTSLWPCRTRMRCSVVNRVAWKLSFNAAFVFPPPNITDQAGKDRKDGVEDAGHIDRKARDEDEERAR